MVSDVNSFGYRMLGALTNPTYYGNLDLAFANVGLSAASTSNYAFDTLVPPINFNNVRNSYMSPPVPFGLEMYSAFADSTYFSNGLLRDYDIGLSGNNSFNFVQSMARYGINPALYGSINLDFSNLGIMGGIGNLGGINIGGSITSVNAADESKVSNTDQAKFERKVRLIKAYDEDAYTDKISDIKSKMKDYKDGIQKLDNLIKGLDQGKLYMAAKELYTEDHNERLSSARNISSQWFDQISSVTTGSGNYKVNTASISKDNVLDVLGTFMTYRNNDKDQSFAGIHTSETWEPLINNNFDAISKALYEKAKDMKKTANETDKKKIDEYVGILKKSQNKASDCQKLFNVLRKIQTYNNDLKAQERYGIPSSKKTEQIINVSGKTYEEEKSAWESAKKKLKQQG